MIGITLLAASVCPDERGSRIAVTSCLIQGADAMRYLGASRSCIHAEPIPASDVFLSQTDEARVKPGKVRRGDQGVPYNCDPLANKRAVAWVNELQRRGQLTGTREQAIESALQALDALLSKAQKQNGGRSTPGDF
jgi:hypothetical protein